MSEPGYCQCGCGERTRIAAKTCTNRGIRKGEPVHFLLGHQMRMPEARLANSRAQLIAQRRSENNPGWKGEHITYRYLHRWVERNKVKHGSCEACRDPGPTQWASLTHEYKRDLNEFVELCSGCHGEYDFLMGWRTKPPGFRGGSRPRKSTDPSGTVPLS